MKKSLRKIIFTTTLFITPVLSYAQITQTLGTINRANNLLDFYKAAIVDPSQIVTLQLEIQNLYAADGSRYRGLNNSWTQKNGLFNYGPLSLDHIELRPEPSPSTDHGFFSITLKQLPFKSCEILSNYPFYNGFVRMELNGEIIFDQGIRHRSISICKKSFPFTKSKNEIKLISY